MLHFIDDNSSLWNVSIVIGPYHDKYYQCGQEVNTMETTAQAFTCSPIAKGSTAKITVHNENENDTLTFCEVLLFGEGNS